MPTVINSAAVVADFGAYFIDNGQNEGNIHSRLMEPFGTMDAFSIVETEDTILRASNASYSEVLQSFQKTFTPKGGVAFVPKTIALFNVKVDESFYPDDLKNQWLSFFTSNNLDRTEWPFVRWFIEIYVMKQINKDLEMKAIYGGAYVAPTAGTANAAEQVMNGIKKTINAAITAALNGPLLTGAPSADAVAWCEQIEAFVKQIPELYWHFPMGLNMSRALELRYREGRRKKYNINYAQVADLTKVENFENINVVGRASQTGSSKIWCTPKGNAVLAMKGGSNKSIMEVEKVDRQVKCYTDWWMGLGFIDDGLVFTNDVELT